MGQLHLGIDIRNISPSHATVEHYEYQNKHSVEIPICSVIHETTYIIQIRLHENNRGFHFIGYFVECYNIIQYVFPNRCQQYFDFFFAIAKRDVYVFT